MDILIKHRKKLKVLINLLMVCTCLSVVTKSHFCYIMFSVLMIMILPFYILSMHEKEEILERGIKYILLTDIRFVRILLIILGHMIFQISYFVRGKICLIPSVIYWGIMYSIFGGLPEYLIKKYSEKGGE